MNVRVSWTNIWPETIFDDGHIENKFTDSETNWSIIIEVKGLCGFVRYFSYFTVSTSIIWFPCEI